MVAAAPPVVPRVRRVLADNARRLLGPLIDGGPHPSGWEVSSWDCEQGLSLVFRRGDRHVLIEIEARDEDRDCFARTRRFNVCARPQFSADRDLSAGDRKLVEATLRFLNAREDRLPIADAPSPTGAQVREIEVERMLVPEGRDRYYLNPYSGCMVGCRYCYVAARADFSRRIEGVPAPAWGRWVDVKINAAEILRRELPTMTPGLVRMSPILTEPYQPIERRYRITRQCLELLLEGGFSPFILTRESRVLDDLDLLSRHRNVVVGMSIPTDDDAIRHAFEPGADTIENRFRALRACSEAGLLTALVVQPAFPMNVANFVDRTAPWIDIVRVDRLHFGETVRPQFEALERPPDSEAEAMARVDTLCEAYRARGVVVDERDDLAGLVEPMLAARTR